MSRTATRRRWRQEKRQQELPLSELQPIIVAVDPDEEECCGGYCREFDGEPITEFLSRNCPSPEDIAGVFYGNVGGWVEDWVNLHTEECAGCQQVMEGVVRKDLAMRKAPIDYFGFE